MSTPLFIASIEGPILLIVGLSLLFYPDQWIKLLKEIQKNHFSLLIGMYMALIIGLLIVNTYNVWAWNLWLIITITGWSGLLKGAFYFLAPEKWIKAALSMKCLRSVGWLYFWSVVYVILGAALSYQAYLV